MSRDMHEEWNELSDHAAQQKAAKDAELDRRVEDELWWDATQLASKLLNAMPWKHAYDAAEILGREDVVRALLQHVDTRGQA